MAAATPALSEIADTNGADNTVLENATVGTAVGITAYAFHIGYDVTYSLTDDAAGQFAIHSTTGVVTVAAALTAGAETITVQAASSDGVSTKTKVFAIEIAEEGEPSEDPPMLDFSKASNSMYL